MPQAHIVKVDTQWGKRFRLQVTLPNEEIVNVRIHACKDCDFIEWSKASGDKVAETTVSADFMTQLSTTVKEGHNRCLSALVHEGVQALKEYSEIDPRLFTK